MFGGSCKVESNDVSFYKYRKGQSLSRPPARCCSSVQTLRSQVLADLALPFISIREEFFLVVQQLLVRVRRVLKVGTLDNGIHGARLLAEPAVDALCHVDVVPSGTPAAVLALLRLDGDGLRGADGLAQLASDAALLTRGVATQDVLAAETRAQRTLLERVVDLRDGRWVDGRGWNQGSESVGRVLVIREPGRGPRQGSSAGIWGATHRNLGLPEVLHRQGHAAEHLRQEQGLRGSVENCDRGKGIVTREDGRRRGGGGLKLVSRGNK